MATMEKIKLTAIQWDQKKEPGGLDNYMTTVSPLVNQLPSGYIL